MKDDIGFKEYVKKRWNGLMKPFVFSYFLSLIIGLVVNLINPTILKNPINILNIIYSRPFTNGVVWFLIALFNCQLLLWVVSHYVFPRLRFFLILGLGLLGFFWNDICGVRLPFFFDSTLSALPYVYLGRLIYPLVKRIKNRFYLLCLFVVFTGVVLIFPQYYNIMDNIFDSGFLGCFTISIIGSLGLIALSELIHRNAILEYIGRNTLIILCFHMYFIMGLSVIIKHVGMSAFTGAILCFLLSTAMTLAVIPFVKRYLSFFF